MEGVPGFVPRRLSDPSVGLFRADERVFDAMLDGWRAQMLARGLTTATIDGAADSFVGFSGSLASFRGRGVLWTLRSSWPSDAPATDRSV